MMDYDMYLEPEKKKFNYKKFILILKFIIGFISIFAIVLLK